MQVYDEYVIKGNTAVMKCHIPSFVTEYVQVIAWIQVETASTYSNIDLGKYIFSSFILSIKWILDLSSLL